jgi:iron complex transport system permease protein
MSVNPQQKAHDRTGFRRRAGVLVLIGGAVLIAVVFVLSLLYGAVAIEPGTIWTSLLHFSAKSENQQIIRNIRLPRAMAATLTGAFLSVSGAIMQGMTRNPLASPSLMGVSSGALLVMALALVMAPQTSAFTLMLYAFLGAGAGALLVFGFALFAGGGLSPAKLVLAGMAVTAFLNACTSAIAIRFNIAKDLSFWYAGGVSGMQWAQVRPLVPVALIGFALALLIAPSITALSLGEEMAKGLGERTFLIKLGGIGAVLLLTGAAVSAAGLIGFVGLIVPHIVRFLVGNDYRWTIPCSAVCGALLLTAADLAARMLHPPFETPVGAVTALIGVPFFLYLARHAGEVH